MSRESVNEIIGRALEDEQFRALLSDQPYDALDGYDLDPEEQGALIAASEPDLTNLGVAPEIAHAYNGLFHISRGGGG